MRSILLYTAAACAVAAQAPAPARGFPASLLPETIDTAGVIFIVAALIAAGAVCILFVLLWNRQLRALVRARTAELEKQAAALAAEIEGRRAIEESQGRLASIIEATPDFVGIADTEGKALYMNRAGRQMIGIGPDEDIGTVQISDFMPAAEFEQLMGERIPVVLETGGWTGQSTFVARDGREVPVLQVIIAHP